MARQEDESGGQLGRAVAVAVAVTVAMAAAVARASADECGLVVPGVEGDEDVAGHQAGGDRLMEITCGFAWSGPSPAAVESLVVAAPAVEEQV
ncbi:hypothetical protein MUK60_41515 [Streptomyces sp. LRE541]|uniref:hypothetical protein n=1 Tax=Streptomyces sp. LRE541 TaxID=2931983 RepID=UPI00200DD8D8|nr:hypothetical protein [Streptomyces sp. LRE541]UPZ33714.1 hypothetical protein MUK60_41515 [Streptomyces sp. LRE541]